MDCAPQTIARIRAGDLPKGNLLDIAKAAGLLAAKKTDALIPHCHPVSIDGLEITFEIKEDSVWIQAEGKSIGRTGIEMEVLTAVSIAALTIYDLLKPIDKGLTISGIHLTKKRGGKSDPRFRVPKNNTAAVLVCSDSTAAGKREDKSGKIIRERLLSAGMEVRAYEVVPDEPQTIQAHIRKWSQEKIAFVFTTGGTGLGPRDRTVEAVREILDREAPGIVEAMRSHGQARTPWAMLSRAVCGVVDETLVVTLPGSSNGAREGMDALLPGVLHANSMIRSGGHD